MKDRFNRRDFLKLAGVLPFSIAAPRLLKLPLTHLQSGSARKNVLVILFDAFSASNLSLHGYQRETTPNLVRLAERAIVYHNHYAGSNFTTSGTASLLTGVLPWTHRAIEPDGTLAEEFVTRNLFSSFPDYYRIAYTHNGWANTLLKQLRGQMEELVPRKSLFLRSADIFISALFGNDDDIASVAWARNTRIKEQGYAYSLFLSHLDQALRDIDIAKLRQQFPRSLPSTGNLGSEFLLDTAINWLLQRLIDIPQPFLGYFHFLPPHLPYNTSIEFFNRFGNDGMQPVQKPEDMFTNHEPAATVRMRRVEYDEFLLYVDQSFAELFEALESTGLLENTWVVFTSDHGEMFERGIFGHGTDTFYQPLLRIPLLIFEPGRSTRQDIYAPTSAIDVLPTLAYLTGQKTPDWTEGVILPPFSAAGPDPDRSVYAARAIRNGKYSPFTRASAMLIERGYKLHYYFGYPEYGVEELVRLYDVENDPEELIDLYPMRRSISDELLAKLKAKLAEADKPYL